MLSDGQIQSICLAAISKIFHQENVVILLMKLFCIQNGKNKNRKNTQAQVKSVTSHIIMAHSPITVANAPSKTLNYFDNSHDAAQISNFNRTKAVQKLSSDIIAYTEKENFKSAE